MEKQQTSSFISTQFQKIQKLIGDNEDIVSVILEDHKPLKELIAVMKDGGKSVAERKQAFMEFAPLLMTHAKAEEKALYDYMKSVSDLAADAFEGDTEHMIADQVCEEIKRAKSDVECGAKIKVLAELVEHHIKEEENDILPKVRRDFSAEKLRSLTQVYSKVQEQIIADGQDDAPHESEIDESKGKLHS